MLGFSAYLLITLICFFAAKFYFYSLPIKKLPVVLLGITGILISSSSLFALFSAGIVATSDSYPVSGVIGGNIHSALLPYLGQVGYSLVFIFILTLCLIVSLEFSPSFSRSLFVSLFSLFRSSNWTPSSYSSFSFCSFARTPPLASHFHPFSHRPFFFFSLRSVRFASLVPAADSFSFPFPF